MLKKFLSISLISLLTFQTTTLAVTDYQVKPTNNTGVIETVNQDELNYLNQLDKQKTLEVEKQKKNKSKISRSFKL